MDQSLSLTTAKLDLVSDRIDQIMCRNYHAPMLKKFSQGNDVESVPLPVELKHLKKQKDFVQHLADGMGIDIKLSKHLDLVMEKGSDFVSSKFNYLKLAPATTTHLVEHLKNCQHPENDKPAQQHLSLDENPVGNQGDRLAQNGQSRPAGRLVTFQFASRIEKKCFGEAAGLWKARRKLPVYKFRQEILCAIDRHQVVLIAEDVGCGSNTQVPQYIFEQSHQTNSPCRVVTILPRKISVFAAAERVIAERGVTGAHVVGHQTRIKNRGALNCHLMFCTTGVFLNTLIEGDQFLNGLTHIIVDQVQERDRFTDLLLGVLRLRLRKHRHLRLILLSSSSVPEQLTTYFTEEKVIRISAPSVPVSELFLEDILSCTNFLTKQNIVAGTFSSTLTKLTPKGPFQEFDEHILKAWFEGSDETFALLMNLVTSGAMSVDYQHSQTGITILMASAAHGKVDVVKSAISYGANPTFEVNGLTPFDLACQFAYPEIADILYTYAEVFGQEVGNRVFVDNTSSPDDLIKNYYDKYIQDNVNLDLIVEVLNFFMDYAQSGAVLVFLPAYSEVIGLRDMIIASHSSLKDKLELHLLHSHLNLADYQKVFIPTIDPTKRKVILATGFAESNVFFDDVVCVIDSGLCRDRENEVIYTRPRKTQWISKASVRQRTMHVRNGGFVFHLYPRSHLDGFHQFPVPEITREQLTDTGLYARLLVPEETRLTNFFGGLPDSPPLSAVRQAVEVLESIGALESSGKVTEIGRKLGELPLEPRLGKALMVANVFKCLDPLLTIVCCLSREDPFIVPTSPDERKVSSLRKHELVAGKFSDHLALLKAYHVWEGASDENRKRQVCQAHYLSLTNLELIFMLRVEMVADLRSNGFIKSRGSCDIRNLNVHAESWTAIKAALTSGLYPNLARYSPVNGRLVSRNDMPSQFHYTSTLLVQEGHVNGLGNSDDPSAQCTQTPALQRDKTLTKSLSHMMMSPWIVFEDRQRAGQFSVLEYCSVVTPVTILLFAGHSASDVQIVELKQGEQDELRSRWSDVDCSDDDYSDMDEEEVRSICREMKLHYLTEEVIRMQRSAKIGKTKNSKTYVVLKIDDFAGFIVDSHAAQLIISMRQICQAILEKCIKEPGRGTTAAEESTLRTILSVLSAEETAVHLPQPSGIGRKPNNVSADSMHVLSDPSPDDLFPVKQYLNYVPPSKGYIYQPEKSAPKQPSHSAAQLGPDTAKYHSGNLSTTKMKPFSSVAAKKNFHQTDAVSPNIIHYNVPAPPPFGRPIRKSHDSFEPPASAYGKPL